MNWVIQRNSINDTYEVGYIAITNSWYLLRSFETLALAAAFINYLNGGNGEIHPHLD